MGRGVHLFSTYFVPRIASSMEQGSSKEILSIRLMKNKTAPGLLLTTYLGDTLSINYSFIQSRHIINAMETHRGDQFIFLIANQEGLDLCR